MVRTSPKRDRPSVRRVRTIPGAREKRGIRPYRVLTQVPQAEKAKA